MCKKRQRIIKKNTIVPKMFSKLILFPSLVNKGACSLAQLLVFDIIKQKNKNFWTFEITTAAS